MTTDINEEVDFTKMATGGSDLTSDEIKQIKCFLCAAEDRARDADKYCIQCKNYYCLTCVRIHTKLPLMQGHDILDKGHFKSLGPDGSLPSYPTQRCDRHPLEVVTMYCRDHDDVACGPCVAISHRSCKHIVSISDEIDNLYPTAALTDAKQKLHRMKKTMEDIKTTKEEKIQKLKEALQREIESVKEFRLELQALLNDMEEATIHELRKEFSRIEEVFLSDVNDADSLTCSLNEAVSQLQKSEGNKAQEFVCFKSSQNLINKGEEIKKQDLMEADEAISFTADQNIKSFMQKIKVLGKIDKKKYALNDRIYKIKCQKQIDVNLQNDKKGCSICMICVTDDGYLLLPDFTNKKLKRVDLATEKVKDFIEFQVGPKAVCTVSKTEAVVALEKQSLQFVSLGEKMTVTSNLTMNHVCNAVAHKDGKLFIGDFAKTLYIYDLKGQEQRRITTDGSGGNIFTNNQQIAVSATADRVFVADCNNGVVVLDSQGNYLSTLRDNDVRGYTGVCTDGRNVFVSGWPSNKIVQFGSSSTNLGEVGKIDRPIFLCLDNQRSRVIVTHCIYNNSKITVLELE